MAGVDSAFDADLGSAEDFDSDFDEDSVLDSDDGSDEESESFLSPAAGLFPRPLP